jgi:hypothetical protein
MCNPMAARFRRIRATPRTRELVSWTIGIVVVLALTLLVGALADQLGWPWP